MLSYSSKIDNFRRRNANLALIYYLEIDNFTRTHVILWHMYSSEIDNFSWNLPESKREDVVLRAEIAETLRASHSSGSPWVEKTRYFVFMCATEKDSVLRSKEKT